MITFGLVLSLGVALAAGHRHPHWHPHWSHSSSTAVSATSSAAAATSYASTTVVVSTTVQASGTVPASTTSVPSSAAGYTTSSVLSSSALPASTSSASASSKPASSSAASSSSAPAATASGAVWQPAVNATWQIVLDGAISLSSDAKSVTPDVSIYDIDLFGTDASVIDTLHSLDKKVICYFSAGSYEDGRPDSSDFTDSDKGNQLDGWPEYWLNTNSANVRTIMTNRIALAKEKGCDGVDPDNVDGYNNDNGLGLTSADAVDYVTFLANEAKSNGLAIGLKNAGEIVSKVQPVVHFCVNEQCAAYDECDLFSPFIDAGKPVFHIEYPADTSSGSSTSSASMKVAVKSSYCDMSDFSTVLKTMDLTGWVEFCNGATATTPVES